jgi:putative DNA primase/helicase
MSYVRPQSKKLNPRTGSGRLVHGHHNNDLLGEILMTNMTENGNGVNPCFQSLRPSLNFIQALAGDSLTTFQTLPDGSDSNGIRPLIVHGPLLNHHETLLDANRRGHAVSIMVNEGDGRGRRAGNVVKVRAVFVDLDGAPLQPIRDALLRPHIIVESSPEKYHVYWLVDGLALQLFTRVQKSLATKFNGDQAVSDLSRVMRVPGFHHMKSAPFVSRLVEINDHPHYCPDEILSFAKVDPASADMNPRGTGRPTPCLAIVHEGSRNSHLTSLAGTMRRRGMSEAAISAALMEENRQQCSPPLSQDEVSTIAESVFRYGPPQQEFALTDVGNAERLVFHHRESLRYCPELGGWIVYDGKRWAQDKTGAVQRMAKHTVRSICHEAGGEVDDEKRRALLSHAKASERAPRIEAMIRLSQAEEGIPARPEDFDHDGFLLNVQNGTLDLRTGELRPHSPDNMLTKICPVAYSPDEQCPIWVSFLDRIMHFTPEMITFLQRALGYSLTGDNREQAWFFLHGTGANGKSTLVNAVQFVLGDYAMQTSASTFLMKRGDEGVRNDMARLRGARFVSASEPNESARLDESLLKIATGGDRITARFLYKELFEFSATFKIFFSANHKPKVTGTDCGFWRRVRLIPFDVEIPESEQDLCLAEKLRGEAPGILTWLVQGCLAWQIGGLCPPVQVRDATAEYREESDPLGDFIADECVVEEGRRIGIQLAYATYAEYCERNYQKPLSKNSFGRAITGRGFQRSRCGGRRISYYLGLSFRERLGQGSPEVPDQNGEDYQQVDPLDF